MKAHPVIDWHLKMQSIKIRSHVGSDGILQLQVPVGHTDKDIEVIVIGVVEND